MQISGRARWAHHLAHSLRGGGPRGAPFSRRRRRTNGQSSMALLAERLDIAEELVRINCHFDQFLALLDDDDCPGRKIDFLLQEMLRETNTIGSKSADVEVARRVVNIKSILEQVRELVQNVE